MNKIFVILRLIKKFTKILCHETLELYGMMSWLDTVRYHLHRVKPLLDFDVSQQHDQLAFIPAYIEQGYHLVFSFVRRDGNACKLKQMS